jgi:hypothetical protein
MMRTRGAGCGTVHLGLGTFIERGRGNGPLTPRQPTDRSEPVPTPTRSKADPRKMKKD